MAYPIRTTATFPLPWRQRLRALLKGFVVLNHQVEQVVDQDGIMNINSHIWVEGTPFPQQLYSRHDLRTGKLLPHGEGLGMRKINEVLVLNLDGVPDSQGETFDK